MKKKSLLSRFYPVCSVLLITILLLILLPNTVLAQQYRLANNQSPPIQTELSDIPEQTPPAVDVIVSADEVTNSSVTLHGSLTSLGSAETVQVYFEFGLDTSYGSSTNIQEITAIGEFNANLTGLKPDNTYHFRAVAKSSNGEAFSDDATFKTLSGASSTSTTTSVVPSTTPLPDQLKSKPPIKSRVTAKAEPGSDTELKSPNEKIKLQIPKGALSAAADIEFVEYNAPISTGMGITNLFELNASDVQTSNKVTKFNKDLQITIAHDGNDLAGLDINSLHLYYLDEDKGMWVPVDSKYDPKTKILTATVNHFSLFGEQANPLKSGPGIIKAFQNDLQSGTATGSYPIEVPPGPSGFQPKIELKYNSGSVDEMKNKRAVGSCVGIGWSLNLGAITYDEANGSYSLEINGVGYKLVAGTNYGSLVYYYTQPDQFFKITRNTNQWDVYDKDGTYYRFGGTSDSQQYHDTSIYYQWNLSRIQDTNGNIIDLTYTQDIFNNTVRSAYPTIVKYANDTARIYFNSSFDYNSSDGNMRYDTPKGTTMNPAPPIVENKKLDSIEVKVYEDSSWQLVRKYYFTYSYTEASSSEQYGGIWYAGTYTLSSITQKDENDSLSLPTTSFTYENKQTYVNDTNYMPQYQGNPGNPASFSWPHLTEIDNGYEGTVTYAYTQIPDTSEDDIWTREVVTTKTTDSGIGAVESYTYTYTDDPQYLINDSNEWESEFRGFSQVRETDATEPNGNYIIHYFNTIDSNDGDAEKLTGLETKTEYYSSDDTLLRTVENQWSWNNTAQAYFSLRRWGGQSLFSAPVDIAVSNDGYTYVADGGSNSRIMKFNNAGTFIISWGTYGTGNGQFICPMGIAVDNNGYVYVADTSNQRIQKFTSTGAFVTKWGTQGSGNGQFNDPWGIAVDSSGYVYVADEVNSRIQKFTDTGTFVTAWGTQGTGNGQFNETMYVAVDNSGYVYVSDWGNNRIQKFTNTGSYITQWGTYGSGNSQFKYPTGVAVDNNGNVFVCDNMNHRVQKFTNTGTFITTWGTRGIDNGQFNYPWGIAVDSSGYVYVADASNQRIQKFTSAGSFNTTWGIEGNCSSRFNNPIGVAIDNNGYIYLADNGNNRIQKFDGMGSFVTSLGTYGTGNGQFTNPQGIAIDGNDNIYVADSGNNRIQKFNSAGSFVTSWGTYGTGNGQFFCPTGIAVSSDGYVYVADSANHRIQKFTNTGTFITTWGTYGSYYCQFDSPQGVAVDGSGYVYVADTNNSRIQKFTSTGTLVAFWGSQGNTNGQFYQTSGITIGADGYVYVTDGGNCRIQKFNSSGSFITTWGTLGTGDNNFKYPYGVSLGNDGYVYVVDTFNNRIQKCERVYSISLNQVTETIGSKVSQTRYSYDSYGNVITEYDDGDTSTNADDATIWRVYNPNTTANILDKPARERTYATCMTSDSGGSNLKKETLYYYDGNNTSNSTPPTKGNLTRVEAKKDASNSISSYYTYDSYGNKLTVVDPNNNTATWTYDATYHTYPATKTYPITGLSESYTYDTGTTNLLTQTDVNGQVTTYTYDTFKRLLSVDKPLGQSQDIQYVYNNWGTLGSQNIYTKTWIDGSNYLWQAQYFDGLGRVVQTQSNGEGGHTIISGTTSFNNRGLTDKQYVSQDIASSLTAYYTTGIENWKYTTYAYDGLGRVTTQTNPDGTTLSSNYSTPWQTTVTDALSHQKTYYYDAFQRLTKVEELNASQQVYATTNYTYDTLGNLTQLVDNASNTTSMTYDWLSRKTAMTDPDMGGWSYGYDANGNLTSQTDAKSQTITMVYDALNRLTNKNYPAGSGMTNITYTYDSTTGGNYGKGQRTGMTDAVGTTSYTYDARGRQIQEKRTISSVDYTTSFAYDGADRNTTITYPTGEVVTQAYNGRGLPNTLSGSVAGSLVTGTTYNGLGLVTQINLGNSLKTTFGYYGTGGTYDTTGGYYGRLWEIKTLPQAGGTALQDIRHTWDAVGNLYQRQDVLASEIETFTYDFLDRLTAVSNAYTQSYAYNQIGNITSMNGNSYTYSTQPHAVTAVGSTSYAYDANGNMTTRGSQTITWDVENRVIGITGGASFVYDGDGNRVKKTESGNTILYVNKYYEKNITTSEVTTNYYLGDRLIAERKGTTLTYLHQDSLNSTSVVTDTSGTLVSSIKYFPFGGSRNSQGNLPAQQFTGQRLDDTGLYYYGARYYDPSIGRFISPDTIVPNPANPQSLNRYTYCSNNPTSRTDPSGHDDGTSYLWDLYCRSYYSTNGVPLVAEAPANLLGTPVDTAPPEPALPGGSIVGASALGLGLFADNAANSIVVSIFEGMGSSILSGLGIGAGILILYAMVPGAGEYYTESVLPWGSPYLMQITGNELDFSGSSSSVVLAGSNSKSREEYDKHQEAINEWRKKSNDLEVDKSNSKSPKERTQIQKEIDKLDKKISGHEKEIKQKWPEGPPAK